MSRYIDAEALIEQINSCSYETWSKDVNRAWWAQVVKVKDNIVECIKRQPTADVVEVRHGEWTGMDGDQCSNCGKSLRDLMDGDSYYSSEFEYRGFDALVACPFCGAKMGGKRREE